MAERADTAAFMAYLRDELGLQYDEPRYEKAMQEFSVLIETYAKRQKTD